jgi:hypothetical protein
MPPETHTGLPNVHLENVKVKNWQNNFIEIYPVVPEWMRTDWSKLIGTPGGFELA